jgi:hypothetical protein
MGTSAYNKYDNNNNTTHSFIFRDDGEFIGSFAFVMCYIICTLLLCTVWTLVILKRIDDAYRT